MADSVGMGAPILPTSAIDHRIFAGNAVTPTQARERSRHQQAGAQRGANTARARHGDRSRRSRTRRQRPRRRHAIAVASRVANCRGPDLVTGSVVDIAGNETLVATPIGLLALQRRLPFPAGTSIAFVVIKTVVPAAETALMPARSGGWLALEEALLELLGSAPALAEQLRAELTPQSGPELAGTLLFLMGALYQGNWPGQAFAKALNDAGQAKLTKRLAEDVSALRGLAEDETTGEWQVVTLPLLLGNFPLAVRLYLQTPQSAPTRRYPLRDRGRS